MSANAALFVFAALLCLHAARSLRLPETYDGDSLLFWQASAYRPTTESVVDEDVIDKLFLKEGLDNLIRMVLQQNLTFAMFV